MTAREKIKAALTQESQRAPEIARAAGTAESTTRIHLRALVQEGAAISVVLAGDGIARYQLAPQEQEQEPTPTRKRPRRCPGSGKVQEATRCQNCEAEFPITTRGAPRMRAHLPKGRWTS